MPRDAPIQPMSAMGRLALLLHDGGAPFLALGLAFAVVSVVLAARRGPRLAIIIISWLSPLPGVIAMSVIYAQFAEMASWPYRPRPSVIASAASYAMSTGLLGILGTIASMSTALVALSRSDSPRTDSSVA